jgi:cobalt-zinc-cadmium efflux system membrane fusion protein
MKCNERLLAVLATSALVVACSGAPTEPEDNHGDEHEEHEEHEQVGRVTLTPEAYRAAGITVAPAARRSVAPSVQVTGTLSYDERRAAIATARIGGRIAQVVADYGQRVAAGEALAWIDSPDLGAAQAEYRRASSMARLGRAEYERAELLLQGEAISRGELLRREAEWRAAEAERETAEQQLHILGLSQDDIEALSRDEAEAGHVYPVRAPIGGRVTERTAISGRVVAPDDELFTVAEIDTLWLFLQVFEKDLPAVRSGSRVTLSCESHPEERFSGTIDFVGQVLDPHSRTVTARAVIDNPDGTLKPGMFVYAQVESPGDDPAGKESLAVPLQAVVSIEGRDVVFVQSGDGAFEPREVVLGRAGAEWVEVLSGLAEGESVAVAGTFTLKSEVLKGGLEEHHH